MTRETHELHPDVVRFIQEHIDSVPHVEALLLLWEGSDSSWSVEQVARRLYVTTEMAAAILEDLCKNSLVGKSQNDSLVYYRYDASWDASGERIARFAEAYRRQLLQVAALIHSRASTAVRDFARSFRIKKD